MNLDDAQIMRRVQRGQFEFFDELVKRHQRPLLRVATSKLADATFAEDVVQEAFLAAFAARHTYNPQFSFRTWLGTILLNLCRRHLKRKARRPKEIQGLALSQTTDSRLVNAFSGESGLNQLLRAERNELLIDLLAELPEPQADALRLRFFAELKYDEIARSMNCSISGAKLRVKNGLLSLAQRLRGREEGSL